MTGQEKAENPSTSAVPAVEGGNAAASPALVPRLELSEPLYAELRRHGEQTYPHECCGILLGRSGADATRVGALIRAGNTRTDSAHNRYHIAPQELIAAQRQGRRQGLDIVGFYHSHPDHPAQWSATDFAEAHWFGCAYVITAIEHGQAQTTNSFLLTGSGEEDKVFSNQPIVFQPEPTPVGAQSSDA